jgi:8-oxo-dGTP pyrophosphatase MutT (NUDIX family)
MAFPPAAKNQNPLYLQANRMPAPVRPHPSRGHFRNPLTVTSASFSRRWLNSPVPVNLWAMAREISAGGVVIRYTAEGWQMAAIEPQKEGSAPATGGKKPHKILLALPKGLVDPGEKPEQTALREVREETGLIGSLITKLGDIKYAYVRSWGDNERVFKIVSFYLLKYESGEIDNISNDMRVEVKQAQWIPLEDAARRLSYRGEKDIVRRAQAYVKENRLSFDR